MQMSVLKLPDRQRFGLQGALQSPYTESQVASLRHPQSGIVDCTPPVTTCSGPCCGTCKLDEIGLVSTGNRLDFTHAWVNRGILSLQFRLTRTRLFDGVHTKCVACLCIKLLGLPWHRKLQNATFLCSIKFDDSLSVVCWSLTDAQTMFAPLKIRWQSKCIGHHQSQCR
jgi:hypothetical protein